MSAPRIMLVPTHATGLANAVAAAVAEVLTAEGQRVRYHHLGPLPPTSSWDRWEGAAFLDPSLYDSESLLALYDVASRGAQLSILSASTGVLDSSDSGTWTPGDVALLLDCPVVMVIDCRGWGAGLRALLRGLKAELEHVDLAGVLLTGVIDAEQCTVLRDTCRDQGLPVVGCLMQSHGPGWDAVAPGPWGLPLESSFLEEVSRQVDLPQLQVLAGQRGFLAPQAWLTDRGSGGPLVMVAGGRGFTPWSRDSIEVLRAAGAQVQRLDLLEDEALPPDAAGLVLAGTIWPADLTSLADNTSLVDDIRRRIGAGLPTLALGGGMLYLLDRVQDSLGRTAALTGMFPLDGEILWDLEQAVHVRINVQRDNVLLSAGDRLTGWVCTELELPQPAVEGKAPFDLQPSTAASGVADGAMTDTLLCSRALIHLAGVPDRGERFVRRCARYASEHVSGFSR